jgi:hypothetical protein
MELNFLKKGLKTIEKQTKSIYYILMRKKPEAQKKG